MDFTDLLAFSPDLSYATRDDEQRSFSVFDDSMYSSDATTPPGVDHCSDCDSKSPTPTTELIDWNPYSEQCYSDFGLILPNTSNDNSPLGSPSSASDCSSLDGTPSPQKGRVHSCDNMPVCVINGVGWACIDNYWYDFKPGHVLNDGHKQRRRRHQLKDKSTHRTDSGRYETYLDSNCQIKKENSMAACESVMNIKEINNSLHEFKKRTVTRNKKRSERVWEFLLRLLADDSTNPRLVEWVDKNIGLFRLNEPKTISKQWGSRKNNQCMTYEKFSRAMRYYYGRKILQPVYGKKLMYQFGPKSTGW